MCLHIENNVILLRDGHTFIAYLLSNMGGLGWGGGRKAQPLFSQFEHTLSDTVFCIHTVYNYILQGVHAWFMLSRRETSKSCLLPLS